MNTVTAADWYNAGFKDGLHGNSKQPPIGPGSKESRQQYASGYNAGRTCFPAMEAFDRQLNA